MKIFLSTLFVLLLMNEQGLLTKPTSWIGCPFWDSPYGKTEWQLALWLEFSSGDQFTKIEGNSFGRESRQLSHIKENLFQQKSASRYLSWEMVFGKLAGSGTPRAKNSGILKGQIILTTRFQRCGRNSKNRRSRLVSKEMNTSNRQCPSGRN